MVGLHAGKARSSTTRWPIALAAGGYPLLHDFSARAGTGGLGPGCRPRMLRLTQAELPPGAMSMASQMFDPPAPTLGLTPAEQRIVLRALDGASDRGIVGQLGISGETVRATWRTIYERLPPLVVNAHPPLRNGKSAGRALERRRQRQR